MKNKKLKPIPKFRSEKEEWEWWQTHDSTRYADYSKAEHWSFPNLKFTTKPITIRLPVATIDRVKIAAHKMDIPYQAFLKQFIAKAAAAL